jgi:hypothetical protein
MVRIDRTAGTRLAATAAAAALALAAGAAAWRFFVTTPPPGASELGAAFDLDVRNLSPIDPALVLFRESAPIDLPLDTPRALALDAADAICVAGDRALLVFNPDGALRRRFDTPVEAASIAVREDGSVVMASAEGVTILSPDGNPTASWPLPARSIPTAVAIRDESVFVADANAAAIRVFALASGTPTHLIGGAEAAHRGGGPAFIVPSANFDVAVGTDDFLWIVDPGRNRVRKVRDNGDFVSEWGESSVAIEGFSGCCNPSHIAIAPDGAFVTSEKGIVRLKLYNPAGEFVGVVAGPDAFDEGTTGIDLAVDSAGRVLALDRVRRQVRVFERK